jgi:hypothetical protein
MALDQEIRRAEQLIQVLDRQIHDMPVNASLRNKLAGACFDMAVEHQKAIVTLVANNLNGSAFALIRALFESYIRGLWLHKCATDAELERFLQTEELSKNFGNLCDDLEKLEAFQDGVLSKVKKQSWKAMNSYTHTGMQQIVRRLTSETIEANYDDDEIIEAINFSCGIGWLVAIAICDVADRVDAANSIFQQLKATFPATA